MLQPFVTPITEGLVLAVLAAAEPDLLLFGEGEFYWGDPGVFVGTVAKGLLGGAPAGAPPIVSRLQFYPLGGLLGDNRFGPGLRPL